MNTSLDAADSSDAKAGCYPVSTLAGLLPGVLLTAAIAAAAFGLARLPGVSALSSMILSIVIGIAIRNIAGTPAIAQAGIAFSLRRILRLAIILLGLQLTVAQAMQVGLTGLFIIVAAVLATFVFTVRLGRLLGVERGLAELIAAGTSICGASAVIATNTVTRASDEDVAYAVACVTVFGSIAMFAYPLLPAMLGLDAQSFGLWAGSSIHEIAQVVAAAFQDGPQAGHFATVAKLSRVMLLAPMVIALGVMASRRASRRGEAGGHARAPIPWFVLGFVVMVLLNSAIDVPDAARGVIVPSTAFLLSMALAAMGLETDIAKLRARGLRPLLLGFAAFAFIASFSLTLVTLTM